MKKVGSAALLSMHDVNINGKICIWLAYRYDVDRYGHGTVRAGPTASLVG
jgi:hypothetical protein